jgi:hypothetical protein
MNIQKKVNKAISKGEVYELLMGKKDYGYLPKYSPSPGPTDITLVYDEIKEYGEKNEYNIDKKIEQTFPKLCSTLDGMVTAASIIMLESGYYETGINKDRLAKMLQKSIKKCATKLNEGEGNEMKSSRHKKFEELKRLSMITKEYGGPEFIPKDLV